jgi:hypothetical protein
MPPGISKTAWKTTIASSVSFGRPAGRSQTLGPST